MAIKNCLLGAVPRSSRLNEVDSSCCLMCRPSICIYQVEQTTNSTVVVVSEDQSTIYTPGNFCRTLSYVPAGLQTSACKSRACTQVVRASCMLHATAGGAYVAVNYSNAAEQKPKRKTILWRGGEEEDFVEVGQSDRRPLRARP